MGLGGTQWQLKDKQAKQSKDGKVFWKPLSASLPPFGRYDRDQIPKEDPETIANCLSGD